MINFNSFVDEFVKIAKKDHAASGHSSKMTSEALERYAAENPREFAALLSKLKNSDKGKGVYRGVVRQMTTPEHGEPELSGKALKALVSAIKR